MNCHDTPSPLLPLLFLPPQYEFKVKGIRKARCALEVSMQGVKVTKRKRRVRAHTLHILCS